MKLTDFTTLSFDCYGTLIDWETGLLAALAAWRARTGPVTVRDGKVLAASDGDLLQAFAVAESAEEKANPAALYPQILAGALERMAANFGVNTREGECAAFGASVGDWPAFPDTAKALAELKQRYKLVILSNIDRASFARSNERLGIEFDAIYTAQDIGSYKPSPRNFNYLLDHLQADLGVLPDQLLHTAQSLYHDHVPARAMGLATCWINRGAGKPGGGATKTPVTEVTPDFIYTSMGEMAAEVAG